MAMSEKPKRGRPTTKENPDHTVPARIPYDLWKRVELYAKLHKQSVSELVRDGLEMRLEYDPRAHRTPESNIASTRIVRHLAEQLTDLSTMLAAGADTLRENLELEGNTEYTKAEPEDIHAKLPVNDSVLQVLQETSSSLPSGEENYASHIEENIDVIHDIYNVIQKIEQASAEDDYSITEKDAPVIQNTDSVAQEIPDFDPTKFALGKACPRNHLYKDTGKSLLRLPGRVCPACDAERARERRKAKRGTKL
jgi:hypothetical protein